MARVKGDLSSRVVSTNSLAVGVTTSVTSSSGQVVLNNFATGVQTATGVASNFSFKFAAATLFPTVGYQFTIYNKSSQSISVLNSANTSLVIIPSGYSVIVTLRDNTTSSGIFDIAAFSNTSFSDTSAEQTALFGRSGLVSVDAWLLLSGVPSNSVGYRTSVTTARVVRLFTNTGAASTYTLGLYSHDGALVNSSLIATLAVVSALGAEVSISASVANGKQLAVKLESGAVTDVLAGVVLKGLV